MGELSLKEGELSRKEGELSRKEGELLLKEGELSQAMLLEHNPAEIRDTVRAHPGRSSALSVP